MWSSLIMAIDPGNPVALFLLTVCLQTTRERAICSTHSIILAPVHNPVRAKLCYYKGRWSLSNIYDQSRMLPELADPSSWPSVKNKQFLNHCAQRNPLTEILHECEPLYALGHHAIACFASPRSTLPSFGPANEVDDASDRGQV
jgi:hypothetical protein